MFIIEDQAHAQSQGPQWATFAEAIAEIKRLAGIPWDQHPNVCPCTSWRTCGRDYEIIEYDTASGSWTQLRGWAALRISATEVTLLIDEGSR